MDKEYLREFRKKNAEIKSLMNRVEEMRALIASPSVSKFEPVFGHSSNEGSAIERAAERLIELTERYYGVVADYFEVQQHIEEAFEILEPEEREIMRCYYIDALSWEEVCEITHYSWVHVVNRIHNRALQKLAEM